MDCNEASSRLPELVDGELSADERRALEEHLAACPRCREKLAVLRACWEALGEEEAPEVSHSFARRFWHRVERPRRLRRLAAAAAILIAIGGGTYYLTRTSQTTTNGNGLEEQVVANVEDPQDVDVINDLDVLEDLDVILALQEDDEQGSI